MSFLIVFLVRKLVTFLSSVKQKSLNRLVGPYQSE